MSFADEKCRVASFGVERDQTSGTSKLISWSTRLSGPTKPAAVEKAGRPVNTYETKAAFRSTIVRRALNGALVSAPSEPAPVVEGLLPVSEQMTSMKNSGNS